MNTCLLLVTFSCSPEELEATPYAPQFTVIYYVQTVSGTGLGSGVTVLSQEASSLPSLKLRTWWREAESTHAASAV